jgi:hypothetical protein
MPDIDLVIDGAATRLSVLMHTGRGLLLNLTGNGHRIDALDSRSCLIDLRRATTADIDLTAVLVRPDGHICWLESGVQPRDSSPHVASSDGSGTGLSSRNPVASAERSCAAAR